VVDPALHERLKRSGGGVAHLTQKVF